MKGERMAKRSSIGSIVRKRFSDITNSQPQSKSQGRKEENNSTPISPSTKDYIDKLVKENLTLMRLIEDRNKLIELSGAELQKLRVSLQKMQLQNWHLAQSNSHILAELNLGKEKLKALQHELACKDALLKAEKLATEGKENLNCQTTQSLDGNESMENCIPEAANDNKTGKTNRRRPARSQSMGPSTTFQQTAEKAFQQTAEKAFQQTAEKEICENKRRRLRRQSARFRSQQREPKDNLFEIEVAKFPVSQPLDSSIHKDDQTPLNSSITNEDKYDKITRSDTQENQRSSVGRPLRRAAEKVQSYKEIPVNIKMRRSE